MTLLPIVKNINPKTISPDIIGMISGETWESAVLRHIREQQILERHKKLQKLKKGKL